MLGPPDNDEEATIVSEADSEAGGDLPRPSRARAIAFAVFTAAVIGLSVGAVAYPFWERAHRAATANSYGGPFRLIDQNGRLVTDRDLLGKPSLIFFGFTYCPEVCPTTLAHMTSWLKTLGPDGNRLNVVYVTIDPERDTAKQLRSYLQAFDPRIRGLTGSPKAIDRMAREYNVLYLKVPLPDGGYTMDHSTLIYMMDAKGRYVGPLAYDEPDSEVLPRLRGLLRL